MAMVAVEVRMEPGDNNTGLGLNEVVRPVTEERTERVTLPAKPVLVRVIVEVAELPATKLAGEAGVAETVKSPVTVTVTLVVWDKSPAITVRV